MPNTRRRKFSVQSEYNKRNSSKAQGPAQASYLQPEVRLVLQTSDVNTTRNCSNNSKHSPPLTTVAEHESSAAANNQPRAAPVVTSDKDVTASSSNIDFCNVVRAAEEETACENIPDDHLTTEDLKIKNRLSPKRERFSHRVKVRSPKRRAPMLDSRIEERRITSTGTNPVNWDLMFDDANTALESIVAAEQEASGSNVSVGDMCRICHGGQAASGELGRLVSACACRGTVGRVHVHCLERWLTEAGKSRCELCGTRYSTQRVHRYGVPKALAMWLLSQNAKQLLVDCLGIVLMSPLAVLAAWLSGRTLAGLMSQDARAAPWPLASTFVLACMTLVCYYCWIVSAATRHALGWWVWYRSQYEVRLQLQDDH